MSAVVCILDGLDSHVTAATTTSRSDSSHRRWSYGLYDVADLKNLIETRSVSTEDDIALLLFELEPIRQAYGETREAAEQNARWEAQANGWQVVEWNDLLRDLFAAPR